MLIYLHKKYVLEGIASVLDTDLPNLETMDGVLAVLSLINMAELGNVLHPDTYQAGVEPKERNFLIYVRKLGRHLLQWLGDHYLIEPAAYDGNSISTTPDKRPLSKLYLLHQVHALQTGMREMQKAGWSPSISGLTCNSLISQLIGCMGLSNDLAGYADTFAWETGTHKVARRSTPLLSEFGTYAFISSRNLLIS
jgi:cytochrome c553